jgi:hypothetical protein
MNGRSGRKFFRENKAKINRPKNENSQKPKRTIKKAPKPMEKNLAT